LACKPYSEQVSVLTENPKTAVFVYKQWLHICIYIFLLKWSEYTPEVLTLSEIWGNIYCFLWSCRSLWYEWQFIETSWQVLNMFVSNFP
jgi:hypothetical protein